MNVTETREDVTARIKEQADIVQVIGEHIELKRAGTRFLGLCPFHGEKTPSFSVHPGQQFFHCFGCGESGDVFSFVMKHQNVDFGGAVKTLAERYHIELPKRRLSKEEEARSEKRKKLFAVSEKASDLFTQCLLEDKNGEAARGYLQKRGVGKEIIAQFKIGYAPAVETAGWNFLGSKLSRGEQTAAVEAGLLVKKDNGGSYDRFRDRIVFPIFSIGGQVCGFGGRIVGEGQPKYLNSPESPIFNKSGLLLGLYQQKEQIRKLNRAILVEGNFDLISLVAHGCENVVAPLGTALTREQLRLIKRFTEEVTLLFDGDDAGGKAAARAVPFFLSEQIAGRVALLPEGHDPDTFVREHGVLELNTLLEKAESLPEFVLGRLIEEHGLSLDGKRKIVAELIPLAKAAASPLQHSVFLSHFAEKLGMRVEELGRHFQQPAQVVPEVEVKRVKPRDERGEPGGRPLSRPQRQLIEFMILNPCDFQALAKNNIRDFLAGGIGEILFLELEKLLKQNSLAEPEELLTALPEGVERRFVANVLLDPPETDSGDGGNSGELDDLLSYLRKNQLKRDSELLLKRIQQAQQVGDQELWLKLLSEQVEVTRKFHGDDV